jgi:hypothetical protein
MDFNGARLLESSSKSNDRKSVRNMTINNFLMENRKEMEWKRKKERED